MDLGAHPGGGALVKVGAEHDDPRRVALGKPQSVLELRQRVVRRGVGAEVQHEVELHGAAFLRRGIRPEFLEAGGDAADGHLEAGEAVKYRGHEGQN